jgi:hypothetical protein
LNNTTTSQAHQPNTSICCRPWLMQLLNRLPSQQARWFPSQLLPAAQARSTSSTADYHTGHIPIPSNSNSNISVTTACTRCQSAAGHGSCSCSTVCPASQPGSFLDNRALTAARSTSSPARACTSKQSRPWHSEGSQPA